jgi:hypothetical protein
MLRRRYIGTCQAKARRYIGDTRLKWEISHEVSLPQRGMAHALESIVEPHRPFNLEEFNSDLIPI